MQRMFLGMELSLLLKYDVIKLKILFFLPKNTAIQTHVYVKIIQGGIGFCYLPEKANNNKDKG